MGNYLNFNPKIDSSRFCAAVTIKTVISLERLEGHYFFIKKNNTVKSFGVDSPSAAGAPARVGVGGGWGGGLMEQEWGSERGGEEWCFRGDGDQLREGKGGVWDTEFKRPGGVYPPSHTQTRFLCLTVHWLTGPSFSPNFCLRLRADLSGKTERSRACISLAACMETHLDGAEKEEKLISRALWI